MHAAWHTCCQAPDFLQRAHVSQLRSFHCLGKDVPAAPQEVLSKRTGLLLR